jgi:hypothetical protein
MIKTCSYDLKLCDYGILIIVFLGIIHCPVFLFKTYNVLETGFCLHLQVKLTQLGPIDKASSYLQTGFCLCLQVKPTQLGVRMTYTCGGGCDELIIASDYLP